MLAAAMAISMTACGSPAKDMQGAAETAADEETSTVETAADRETSAVETVSEIAGNTTESTENAATDAEIDVYKRQVLSRKDLLLPGQKRSCRRAIG